MKYVDSKWQSVADEDSYKLTKLEGQVTLSYVWICYGAPHL